MREKENIKSDDGEYCYYTFAHQMNSDREFVKKESQRIPANQRWAVIRFNLEKKFGLHDYGRSSGALLNRQYKPNMLMSFLTGYWARDVKKTRGKRRDMKQIEDGFYIRPADCIVLYRLPMPHGFEPYVPEELENMEELRHATEDERLVAIAKGDAARANLNSLKLHASVYGTSKMPVPDKGYVCNHCWKPGHYRQFCQDNRREMQMALQTDQRRIVLPMPKGIPAKFFELATQNEDFDEILYYDEDRKLWKRKK
jgi:hypothetical protein